MVKIPKTVDKAEHMCYSNLIVAKLTAKAGKQQKSQSMNLDK